MNASFQFLKRILNRQMHWPNLEVQVAPLMELILVERSCPIGKLRAWGNSSRSIAGPNPILKLCILHRILPETSSLRSLKMMHMINNKLFMTMIARKINKIEIWTSCEPKSTRRSSTQGEYLSKKIQSKVRCQRQLSLHPRIHWATVVLCHQLVNTRYTLRATATPNFR